MKCIRHVREGWILSFRNICQCVTWLTSVPYQLTFNWSANSRSAEFYSSVARWWLLNSKHASFREAIRVVQLLNAIGNVVCIAHHTNNEQLPT